MSALTSFVFLSVLLASVAADYADRESCSPGRACEDVERKVNDKRDAYETLCNSDSNLSKKCCKDIKKEVEKYQNAYDVFCASNQPIQAPTTHYVFPIQATTRLQVIPSHQYQSTQAPTRSQVIPTHDQYQPTQAPTRYQVIPTYDQYQPTQAPTRSQVIPTYDQYQPTQAPTRSQVIPTHQYQPTQAPTRSQVIPTPPASTTQAKDTCRSPKALGMQSLAIPNYAVTASSKHSSTEQPYYARLMNNAFNHACLWAPSQSDPSPWIQIFFFKKTVITAVATQGSCNNPREWVTSYVIRYRENGKRWTYYNDGQLLPANKDKSSVVKNEIETPFEAHFVRIYPKTKNNDFYSMRMELYGCRADSRTLFS